MKTYLLDMKRKSQKEEAMKIFLKILGIVFLLLYFTACGGGSSSASTTPTTSQPNLIVAPTPTPTPGATPTPTPVAPTPTPVTTTTMPPVTTTTLPAPPPPYAFGGGNGTIGTPYIIQTAIDMQHIQDFPAAYYWINNPINMTGISFQPIPIFSGVLYGNNYMITGLTIHLTTPGIAAFAVQLSGTITQFNLVNASISGLSYAAAYAGTMTSTSLISGSTLNGTVTSPSGGNGFNTGTGTPSYVTKQAGASIVSTSQSVYFNTNHVTQSF